MKLRLLASVLLSMTTLTAQETGRPNFVIVFCDDLGYGDLGAFGHPTIRTPSLDRMAREGSRLTQFYTGASVCTPSRAALLTGRLPIRNGMCSDRRRVLFPDSKGGLPASEVTVAECLKRAGYATGCFGKWHLGHLPEFLPRRHGFDRYYGIPYSNDMDRVKGSPKGRAAFNDPRSEYWNVPILSDEEVVERPADQTTITRRFTDEAIRFINQAGDRPFFVYLAHSMPHVPLFASERHLGNSPRGLYGDVIEEIDANTGRLLDHLRSTGKDRNTLVMFTSDNGPWLAYGLQGGSAGLLRSGKGTTFEGGMRVPTIAWWPGRVPAGVTSPELMTAMDVLPTLCSLSGAAPPTDRTLDGVDVSQALFGGGPSPRTEVWYYRGAQLFAARQGRWKAHFTTWGAYGAAPKRTSHERPLLYDLHQDPSETRDMAARHPEVLESIRKAVAAHRESVKAPASQLERR